MNTIVTPPAEALADCDLLMKGGITSGVVYPKLIARLARQYRFKSIGGTSAGAIAAAGCAAAELARRRNPQSASFDELAKLPAELGTQTGSTKGSMLFHLFQPAATMQDHFAVLVGSLNAVSPLAAVAGALRAMLLKFWPITGLAAVVALLLLAPALRAATGLGWWPAVIGAVVLLVAWFALIAWLLRRLGARRTGLDAVKLWVALGWLATALLVSVLAAVSLAAGALVALVALVVVPLALALAMALCAWRFAATLLNGLHGNFFGLCSGRSTEPGQTAVGLTDWLTGYFNGLAALVPDARPLSFGDLWGEPRRDDAIDLKTADMPPRDRLVNLEVMTTAVSQRMCFSIPFRDASATYYYDPVEWANLFPPDVMQWLQKVSEAPGSVPLRNAAGTLLQPLPPNRHLPVVVAVRMSLSFPVLLSAVPLYACDFSVPKEKPEHVKRVWFSDGGISSNMPLHFFDAPLPGHPTFAVNLKEEHPEHPIDPDKKACEQDGRVYLVTNNRAGMQRYWAAPTEGSPQGIVAFLGSIIDTMQNWRDEMQFPYPGYRDRIVQISQRPDEGGLNLNMPRGNIDALSDAGECAADRLAARFHPDSTAPEHGGWANHEQLRLRTFLALAEELARHPRIQDRHWDDVVALLARSDSGDYSAEKIKLAQDALVTLRDLGERAAQSGVTLTDKAPKPRPTLRIAPRI